MVVPQGRPRCTHREEAAAAAEEGGAAREVSATGPSDVPPRLCCLRSPIPPPPGVVPKGPRASTRAQLSSSRSDVCLSPSLTHSDRHPVGPRAAPPRGVPGLGLGRGVGVLIDGSAAAYRGRWREPWLLGPPGFGHAPQERIWCAGTRSWEPVGGNFGEVAVRGGALCGVELGTPWTRLMLTSFLLKYFKVSLRQILLGVGWITWPKK